MIVFDFYRKTYKCRNFKAIRRFWSIWVRHVANLSTYDDILFGDPELRHFGWRKVNTDGFDYFTIKVDLSSDILDHMI